MSAPIRDATDTIYHPLTVECPECEGEGVSREPVEGVSHPLESSCEWCNGSGFVDRAEVEDPSMDGEQDR